MHPPGSQASGLVALTLGMLARIGVILLLFEVSLESTVRDMLKVGWYSLVVAVIGVVAPFGQAMIFLIGSVLLGDWLSPRLFRVAAKLQVHGMLMVIGLAFCFELS